MEFCVSHFYSLLKGLVYYNFFYSSYFFFPWCCSSPGNRRNEAIFSFNCLSVVCNFFVRVHKKVHISRVSKCLSPRPNWDPPIPSPASVSPLWNQVGTHSLAVEGVGCKHTPFTLSTITYKVVVYAPAGRVDTLTLFLLNPYMYSVVR